jgi:hypothetical protein
MGKGLATMRHRLLLIVLTLGLWAFAALPAHAATGDVLRVITASGSCSVNVGLAFDGTDLYMSCSSNNLIKVVSPADGSLVRDLTVASVNQIGAMGYDKGRNRIWICNGGFGSPQAAVPVNPQTGDVDPTSVATRGCPDGLSYDADGDSLWSSPDAQCGVSRWKTDGTDLGESNVCSPNPLLGSNGNSGIAVGGPKLYLANNGGSQVYEVEKDFSASTLLFESDRRLEDLECDDVTFAPKDAMWIQDAFDRILTAVEIPEGRCGVGGASTAPPAEPSPAPPAPTPQAQARRDRSKPQVVAAGVPTACVRGAFSARFHIRDSSRLRRATVFLDGKRVKRTTRKAFAVRVKAAGLKAGRHTIRVVAVDRAGNRRTVTRVFARCAQVRRAPSFTG